MYVSCKKVNLEETRTNSWVSNAVNEVQYHKQIRYEEENQ